MPHILRDPISSSNNTVMLLIIVALSMIIFGAFLLSGYEGSLLASIPPQVGFNAIALRSTLDWRTCSKTYTRCS
jgi:hypothetical protein